MNIEHYVTTVAPF